LINWLLIPATGHEKAARHHRLSLRVGVYRILYDIDDASRTITVYRVKHRRDAYR
jgi:mRNA-degrading endonuclease RelE of RelBE toxin-antitoxin system